MTDIFTFKQLCIKNDLDYHSTELYDEKNELCGWALWLPVGHAEFDLDGKLTNVIAY